MAKGMKPRRLWQACSLLCAVIVVVSVAISLAFFLGASAQEQAPAPQGPTQQSSQPQQPLAPQPQQPAQAPDQSALNKLNQADAQLIVKLVRTTLVAVHQANVTGNYTVLRDLAAPGFRDKNSAADLALIFASIRQQKIDLGPVVYLDPHLSQAGINQQGMLHLAGRLETHPVPVSFELLFQSVSGVWKLFGVSISPVQQSTLAPTPPAAPSNVSTASPAPKASPPKRSPPQRTAKPSNAGQGTPAQSGTQTR
jgi:hypothetical protein